MKRITVLEPNVANKIAAGEVVERPASIVKELLENSLDAGATAVTVEIRGGGVDYIRITDNGCGIPSEDVPTAFLRHATSKLTSIEDLDSLTSFGFRGEALASIAAVSKVSMRTRTAESDCGTHIAVQGGKQTSLEPCACPTGTTIEVNELFFNVPARLKFIKSQRAEAAAITDYVSRIMLANPQVAIKLIGNGKILLQTNGSSDLANVILSIYGSGVFASLYKAEFDDGYMRISGYVGGESIARNNRLQQSVFINGRYIRSALISNAVQRAFLTRLMNHRFPFFVLNITISSREVDVNVHPNKLSVRFRDEERVSSAVTQAVSTALKGDETVIIAGANLSGAARASSRPYAEERGSAHQNEIETEVRDIFKNDAPSTSAEEHTSKHDIFIEYPQRPTAEFRDSGTTSVPDFDPFPHSSIQTGIGSFGGAGLLHGGKSSNIEPDGETSEGIPVYHTSAPVTKPKFSEKSEQLHIDTDQCRIIGTAFDTYIIVQQGEAIYYIDQHAAHERIWYEKLISGKLKFDSQLLAVPMIVSLDPVSFACVSENIERLEEFGYSIDVSNEPHVRIDAVPNIPGAAADKFFRDAVDCLIENSGTTEIDLMRSRLIQMSCKRAVKAGDALDIRQLKAIVDAYSDESAPLTCPHGRPVLIRVSKTELQKLFKRII